MVFQAFSTALVTLNRLVHPRLFPYPLGSTIHAARTSIAYQANARRSPSPLPWGTYIAGYLVMCWGGTFLSRNFLGLPQPVVYLIPPYINYVTVHLVLTLVFYKFPTLLNPKLFDTVLFPVDAVVRVAAVTSTVAFLSMPSPAGTSVHPALTLSPLTHMVIGALSSSGGGITASTLSTWSPSWSFSTPPILRAGTGLWGSVDSWGGAVVAVIYGTATGHEAFSDVTAVLSRMRLVSTDGAKMESLEARALAAAVLSVLFGIRAWKVHWAASEVPSDRKPAAKSKTQ